MTDDRAAGTVRWLRSIDDRLTVTRHVEPGRVVLELHPPPGAEYVFRLSFHENDCTLAAVPTCDPDVQVFWHQSFERLGAVTLAPVEHAFHEFVLDVISCESRITQRRGLFFHRFVCEVRRTPGWQRVGGRVLALRSGYRAPHMSGRIRVYHSPALVTPV